jgi:hypothetical protein
LAVFQIEGCRGSFPLLGEFEGATPPQGFDTPAGTWDGARKIAFRIPVARAQARQTFREIREDDCYYVDKTAFALRMIREGKAYFLSRPRRFGKSLFLDTLAELFVGNQGRLDMAVKFNGQVYLFEFKVVEDEAEGRALRQIREKGYADKYRALGQPIHLIGLEFSKKERNVAGFEVSR